MPPKPRDAIANTYVLRAAAGDYAPADADAYSGVARRGRRAFRDFHRAAAVVGEWGQPARRERSSSFFSVGGAEIL
ncbi:MAG: hypothetical protein ACOC1F_08710 [Myxococcota bacterium]